MSLLRDELSCIAKQSCFFLSCKARSYGLTVFLDTLITPTGESTPLRFENPQLPPLCTAFRVNATTPAENADFDKVYRLTVAEPGLFMALNDLIVAITLPHQAPINCRRVAESHCAPWYIPQRQLGAIAD